MATPVRFVAPRRRTPLARLADARHAEVRGGPFD
jgi:hypothetical protein